MKSCDPNSYLLGTMMLDLYHLSLNQQLPKRLTPRAPEGKFTKSQSKSEISEPDTPRVSVAPTILGCVRGIYPNIYKRFEPPVGATDIKKYTREKPSVVFAVYQAVLTPATKLVHPSLLTSKRYVWDAHVTDEYWITTSVEFKKLGSLEVIFNLDDPGLDVYPFNDPSMASRKVYPYAIELGPLRPGHAILKW